jgi:VRR-NUC domain
VERQAALRLSRDVRYETAGVPGKMVRGEMMKNTEHLNQVTLFQWAGALAHKYSALNNIFAIPNGGHRHIGVAVKLKAEGVKAGIPDICLAYPAFFEGDACDIKYCGLYIEMKSESGRATPEQLSWLLRLEQARYKTVLCHKWTEAALAICDYLDLPDDVRRQLR